MLYSQVGLVVSESKACNSLKLWECVQSSSTVGMKSETYR